MFAAYFRQRRRLLVPEVVQTSAMDCGPASLKCLLEGFHIPVSYGRLREACQTDVDGSSIDTMEEVAMQLGLEAEQIMVPLDHLLLPGAEPLPALIVVRRANHATHFLVAWRRHGRFIQLMDPTVGRRWLSAKRFLEEIYVHTMPVSAASWREWAVSDAFCGVLKKRLARVGVSATKAKHLIDRAHADESWRPLAILDAATRMTEAIVRSDGLPRRRPVARVIERFAALSQEEGSSASPIIPSEFWSAQPTSASADGEEQVLLRDAVLVHVRGRLAISKQKEGDLSADSSERAGPAAEEASEAGRETSPGHARLPPELIAALEEKPSRPGLQLLRLLRDDGILAPFALLVTLALAATGIFVEALMFRGLFDIGRDLHLSGQRLGAVGVLIIFAAALVFLQLPIVATVLRMGRRLETRLRIVFMDKIPRLSDRYFHSRLTSDMTERSHSLHRIRLLPALGERFIRLSFELMLTTLGIIWLDPASAPLAMLAATLAVAVPLVAQPVLTERDLRLRNHSGGLSRFYLDALLGLCAVRAHGAERAVRQAHEDLLIQWANAGLSLQRAVVSVEGLQLFVGFGLSVWLLFSYFTRAGESGGLLLFIYWVLNVPMLGEEIGLVARQYPDYRNVTLRLLEPLGALEETDTPSKETGARLAKTGAEFVANDTHGQRTESSALNGPPTVLAAGADVSTDCMVSHASKRAV